MYMMVIFSPFFVYFISFINLCFPLALSLAHTSPATPPTPPPIPRSLCEQLYHGQKHIIFLCYHSNIIIHFEVFDFIEPYSTRFLYKYAKCFYVFLLLYNTCFMIMSCIPQGHNTTSSRCRNRPCE